MHGALSAWPLRPATLAWACLASAITGCHLAIDTSDLEGGCPAHSAGPRLVQVDSASGPYCIDSTEVTNAHYKAFVDAKVDIAPATGCEQVTSYLPTQTGWLIPGTENFPVAHVSWCQAFAYCRWAGKRLCGKIGGDAVPKILDTDPTESQWFNACSRGGTRDYPYGSTFDPKACVGPGVATSPLDVGKLRGCEGGYPGIFDMSGNVWEWTDACDIPGTNVSCHAFGGAWESAPPTEFMCKQTRNWVQTSDAANIGFRCCQDL